MNDKSSWVEVICLFKDADFAKYCSFLSLKITFCLSSEGLSTSFPDLSKACFFSYQF